jgi:hypothetical protein
MTGIAEAYSRLADALAEVTGLTTTVLPERQMLIHKHLIEKAPDQPDKNPALTPAKDGFLVYLRVAPPQTKSRPQQRRQEISHLPAVGVVPQMDMTSLSQSWELPLLSDGSSLSITARCGSARVRAEVNYVLAIVGRTFTNPGKR